MELNLQNLQNTLLNDSTAEEKVEVNQRHLIDKILARYSAEHTIYRELLQNSNDAGAHAVQIIFNTTEQETSGFSFPWLQKKANVTSVTYKNDGAAFSEDDFRRLRKIAEGNPDEQKIGFFGVGFYSLFSICEEPFITSGNETMGFFWKNDMLYTKRGILPEQQRTNWTTFFLRTREPIPVPDTDDFAKFLVLCLAFTTNIRQAEIFVNDHRILHFERKSSTPKGLTINPAAGYQLKSPHKFFKLLTVEIAQIQIDLEIFKTKNSEPSKFTVFSKTVTAQFDVSLPRKVSEEMYRTTKKQPPKTTNIRLILSNFEEMDSTMQTIKGAESIFGALIPSTDKQGRVFIGFPTHQTTGCAVQLAGHLIPTVERESIDFVDKTLAIWNIEYLAAAGLLCRICLDEEMGAIKQLLGNMVLDESSAMWFFNKVAHNLKTFYFNPSTPSPVVGNVMNESFLKCSSAEIPLISSSGKLLPVSSLRKAPSNLMKCFLKNVPTLDIRFASLCPDVVEFYIRDGRLKEISIDDVLQDIFERPLDVTEITALLTWWIEESKKGKVLIRQVRTLQSCILYKTKDGIKSLSMIKYFSSQRISPKDFPLPSDCLPLEISKNIETKDLEQFFWGWKELTMVDWTQFIVHHEDFGINPNFTEKVMNNIGRLYMQAPTTDRVILQSLLGSLPCIVTQRGMKKPSDSYFENVNLFQDLPKIAFEHQKTFPRQFLKEIGVREHVDLQMVFDRIEDLDWDQVQLIKYLASVQEKLDGSEINRLCNSAFLKSSSGADNMRYRASDLYTPIDKFSKIGVNTLGWKGRWKFTSDEAKLMNRLGMKNTMPLEELLTNIVNSNEGKRKILFNFFMENFDADYQTQYHPVRVRIPFLPIQNSNDLSLPLECFSDPGASQLGVPVLDQNFKIYSGKLKIPELPDGNTIVRKLENNPPSSKIAPELFKFLAANLVQFEPRHLAALKTLQFIPVTYDQIDHYYSPSNVYFKQESSFNQKLFVYIDFGEQANSFLRACGVQEQPSPLEIAQSMVKNPRDFLSSGFDEYLVLLRQVAANFAQLKQNRTLLQYMKQSPFLVAITNSPSGNDVEGNSQQFSLAKASDIYLIDDTVLAQLFKPPGAPIEEILEAMYLELGSTWLSQNVEEHYSASGGPTMESNSAVELRTVINERAPLLMYDGRQNRLARDLQRNALAIISNINVLEIPRIEIIRKFKGASKNQETTSCVVFLQNSKEPTLLVTKEFDYFDVATKPRLNDSLLISTLISTSLTNLTRKGFPVERILNLQKPKFEMPAAERKQNFLPHNLENQPNRTQNSPLKLKQPEQSAPVKQPQQPKVGDDLNHKEILERPPEIKRSSGGIFGDNLMGMFKNLTNSLGLPNPLDEQKNNNQHKNQGQQLPGGWNEALTERMTPPPITKADRKSLSSKLQHSVATVQNSHSSNIRTNFPTSEDEVPAPATKPLCNVLADQDLQLLQTINDIPVYVDKKAMDYGVSLFSESIDAIERFSNVLKFLSVVFGLAPDATQIYIDNDASTVAFNRNRQLFFNARFYIGYHYEPDKQEQPDTYFYWFMTFCHELAHNFHGPHDSTHEYWMSSFAEQYLHLLFQHMQLYKLLK